MVQIKTYKSTAGVGQWLRSGERRGAALFAGDCETLLSAMPRSSVKLIITSPPYCMGKEYEKGRRDVDNFVSSHARILPLAIERLRPGGSLCWQVGFHLEDGVATPLDFLIYEQVRKYPEMRLRNRIVWTFGHGLHCSNRFSGRHETVLWFTKGDDYRFELDAVRVPQKYPGKRFSAGPKKGEPSGNPRGKNPSDVWDIPNVKGNHVEKADHPCQFPVGLAQRLVRALSRTGDIVLDPFCGVASTGVAALVENRRFLGAEIDDQYLVQGRERLREASRGKARYRPAERAIHIPSPKTQVAIRPSHFAVSTEQSKREAHAKRR